MLFGADPVGHLHDVPPVDAIAVERTVLEHGVIRLHVRNDGTAPVTIAQVIVDDAFWQHTADPRTLGRLGTATVTVAYPWEEGQPLDMALVTSTGVRIPHEVAVASLTPKLGVHALGDYAVLGVAIGVVPVAVGLLWLPALRRASAGWARFFLAFAVGLLAFLLVETVAEGLAQASEAPARLRGVEVFAVGFAAVLAAMAGLSRALAGRVGLGLAYLVAVGVGLHNLGEGLAVSSAIAAGEVALGASLVMGFAAHNTTEGLAIASPLGGGAADEPERAPRVRAWHFVALVAVAGGPAVLGAWIGAFAVTPTWAALAFGVAAGALAQVVWAVGRTLAGPGEGVSGPVAGGFACGVAAMYLTALLTA